LAQLLGKLKRDGDGQLSEVGLSGLFDYDLRGNAVADGYMGFKRMLDALFE
jgi:hypothetical protein